MNAMIETKDRAARAYLITIRDHDASDREAAEAQSLSDELARLARTLGAEIASREIIRVRETTARYGTGTGKAEEIAQKLKDGDFDCLIFDRDISPSQQRNWEKLVELPVLDRQEVILQIFASRAKTKEASLQVELARLEHSLPRLSHAYIDLSRQRGGRYGTKGSGETKLELDRRNVQHRIHQLKDDIEEVRKNRATQRKRRDRMPLPSCALVGYTNAGKSSLLNAMTAARVLTEDKLFATLDPTTRRMDTGKGRTFLLTDTVGFIRDLPHELVDAFHATLEEAALADLIIEVVDAADSEAAIHHETTLKVLRELGADSTPMILALNKSDLVADPARSEELGRLFPNAVAVSATTGLGLDVLTDRIDQLLSAGIFRFRFPNDRHDLPAMLHRNAMVLEENYLDDGIEITARVDDRLLAAMKDFLLPS